MAWFIAAGQTAEVKSASESKDTFLLVAFFVNSSTPLILEFSVYGRAEWHWLESAKVNLGDNSSKFEYEED